MTAAIDVLCCPLAAIDAALLARYEQLLSDAEHERLRSFRAPAAAREFVAGRALLRSTLAERLHCDPRALQFSNNADGKPELAFPASRWQFNLSHSHDWLVLALTEGGSVGVDIEAHARRNNLPAIAQRFFSVEENARLAQLHEMPLHADAWRDQFVAVWTLKEAHAKALGCGLLKILPYSSVAVDLAAGRIDWTLSGIAAGAAAVSSWLYRLDANSTLALVAHDAAFAEPLIQRCVPLRIRENVSIAKLAEG